MILKSAALALLFVTYTYGQAGVIDPTFDPGVGADGDVAGLAVQADNKVIIVGNFTNVGGIAHSRIARLNSNGSVDETFYRGTGANDFVFGLALRNDAIYIVGRFFTEVHGKPREGLARLNPDGTLAEPFFASAYGYSVDVLPNGKIVVGGTGGMAPHRGVLRFLPSGAMDESFQIAVDRFGLVFPVAAQPDNKTLFGGNFIAVNDEPRWHLGRANADGSLDSFSPEGGSQLEVDCLAVRPDGKIYQGGYILSRLNPDGSIDHAFERQPPADRWPKPNGGSGYFASIAVQLDGKAVAGGHFTVIDGTTRNNIARFENNGMLDDSFGHEQSLANGMVRCVAIQRDGRILIGGQFTNVNGIPRNRIARLLGDAPVLETQRTRGGEIVASWPAAYTNWVMESTKNEKFGPWEMVTNTPVVVDGINYMTNRIGSTGKFYRLVKAQ